MLEEHPKYLYAGFITHPMDISIDLLSKPLVSNKGGMFSYIKYSKKDEEGIYLASTIEAAEKLYIYSNKLDNFDLSTSNHIDEGAVVSSIKLPVCGVILEVDTLNLPLRKANVVRKETDINEVFDEWIVSEVPLSHFTVKKIILAFDKNDPKAVKMDIDGRDQKVLQASLAHIKLEFKRREKAARTYATFIETLTSAERMNEFVIKREWKHYVENIS